MARIPDPWQWKYEGMAEGFVSWMRMRQEDDPEILKDALMGMMAKVYRMGADETRPPVVPVSDYTSIPEIFANAKHRWDPGRCS